MLDEGRGGLFLAREEGKGEKYCVRDEKRKFKGRDVPVVVRREGK